MRLTPVARMTAPNPSQRMLRSIVPPEAASTRGFWQSLMGRIPVEGVRDGRPGPLLRTRRPGLPAGRPSQCSETLLLDPRVAHARAGLLQGQVLRDREPPLPADVSGDRLVQPAVPVLLAQPGVGERCGHARV